MVDTLARTNVCAARAVKVHTVASSKPAYENVVV